MGNAVFKTDGLKKVEDELEKCDQKNSKLIGDITILKTNIEALKENEAVNMKNNDCKQKISLLKTEVTTVLEKEKAFIKDVSELKKKLKTAEKEKENLKSQFAVNDTNLKTELRNQQTGDSKRIETLRKRVIDQNKKIKKLETDRDTNKKMSTDKNEEYKKLIKECDDRIKELSLSSNGYKMQFDTLKKDYVKLQKEYDIVSMYKKFNVNNETKTIKVVPENRYSIKINHVDVQPAGYAKITYSFVDGKNDVFKFKGNGGLEFINSKGVPKRFGMGSHGAELKQHLELLHNYTVVCSSVSGVNTWEFKSLSGVKKIVLEEKSNWAGLKNVSLLKDTSGV